ncbi:hypothetical protein [Polyangium jinanense]|uniref:GYF domain-containing protein n=1 Tax=Polyangium jinanense TaxID=2829994 RepID=A0A9X4AUU8_9BACT|nr:hypothetical protein [Polyangium jinanense]MDC3956589.1 hypothetical protein [Polyangium jinanense]MDC3985628.1 hypothetical protein [Polyangium jinanense]
MSQNVEFLVSEQGNIRGPMRLEAVRREIGGGTLKDPLFRMEGCKRFLPGAAWDPISDLFPSPSPPDAPEGVVAEALPRDLAKLDPQARDKLLWFVEDTDGVMGPVTGAFVVRGLMTGRIPISSGVSLVSVPGWIRGTAVFPAALEGATAIRKRPMSTFTCPYCLEPVMVGSTSCLMCGEFVGIAKPRLGLSRVVGLVGIGLALVLAPLLGGALSVRGDGRGAGVEIPSANAAPSPGASASPGSSASAATSAPADPAANALADSAPAAAKRLEGKVAAKIDVAADAEAAILLPQGHVAVARRVALDVVDPRSGVVMTSSREAQSARVIERVGGALYALGQTRIGALEPDTLRVLRWIEPRTQLLPGAAAASAGLAIFPSAVDRSVLVVGTEHHVEIARFRFGGAIPSAAAIDAEGTWAVASVADPRPRAYPDAIEVFAPLTPPSAQLVRHLSLGDPVAAVAVQSGFAFVALGSSRIVRVTLEGKGLLAPPNLSRDTCTDPAFVRAAPRTLVVGCRAGRALSLHAPATLTQDTRLELGSPVTALEVSPSGDQALVVTGAPSPGVYVVDLATGEPVRVDVTDEVTSVRFGKDAESATAFSARARRVWVLR